MEKNKEKKINIEDLMTVDEYSAFKKVDRRTVYNWIKEGKVKSRVIFGKNLIDINSFKQK